VEPEKITQAARLINGLTKYQWNQIKEVVDRLFDYKASKVELGDFAQIEMLLEDNLK
jgi:hypothetical protein